MEGFYVFAQLISITSSDQKVFKAEVALAHRHTAAADMKTDSPAQAVPFAGSKQSLIEDARRERSSSSAGSLGPARGPRHGDCVVFEEKSGRVTLNVIFTLSGGKNAGFFKAGKIFEVTIFEENA